MSYLVAFPEYVAAATTDLANIGSTISAANAAAAGPTSQLIAAAADEVSTAVTSLFSEHAQVFQALSAQAEAFHRQFLQTLNAAGGAYVSAEAADVALLQTVGQNLQALINAPAQTLLGPIVSLTSGSFLQTAQQDAAALINAPAQTLLAPLISAANSPNIGGLANIPYNLFANVANIPYYESLALKEYAYALGPAGQTGGVPGWIPPGATVANGGVRVVNGQPYYALGGTGSWWMESIGNTWGWDNGNWPQLAAIVHFILPFQATKSYAEQLQIIAQANFIAGTDLNTEFQGTNFVGYLGRWLQGSTPLSSLLAGTTYPTVLTNTIGTDVVTPYGTIINVNPPAPDSPGPNVAIWSGQPAQLQPLAPLQALAANLTASPAQNPIMFPDLNGVVSDATQLGNNLISNFNPFVTGSFLYWGAPTAYSIPSVIGGTIQNLTGIPNQFPLANYGAEPLWGYTADPSSLATGLPEGARYVAQGVLGYLNPNTYVQGVNNVIDYWTDPAAVLRGIPLLGYFVDTQR